MSSHAWSPTGDDWLLVEPAELAALLLRLLDDRAGRDGRRGPLVLIDGHSGSGKTTLAGTVAAHLAARYVSSAIVHTDDLAWRHHPVDWAGLLVDGVLAPWRLGEAVDFRPPAWVEHHRGGGVRVPPGRPALVVEGVGAGRTELAEWGDLLVWVASHEPTARARGIARDISLGRSPAQATAFWEEWMGTEIPFLAAERPWERAELIVDGTPPGLEPGAHPRPERSHRVRLGVPPGPGPW